MTLIDRQWGSLLVTMLGMLLVLGLASVWLNIERMDTAYELRKLETAEDEKSALLVKLELERNSLTNPYHLREVAGELGLSVAKPGQIRRITDK